MIGIQHRLFVVAIFLLLVFSAGARGAPADVRAEMAVGVIFEDGRVMFYGAAAGKLAVGAKYDVYIGDVSLGAALMTDVKEKYALAKIVSGDPAAWREGVKVVFAGGQAAPAAETPPAATTRGLPPAGVGYGPGTAAGEKLPSFEDVVAGAGGVGGVESGKPSAIGGGEQKPSESKKAEDKKAEVKKEEDKKAEGKKEEGKKETGAAKPEVEGKEGSKTSRRRGGGSKQAEEPAEEGATVSVPVGEQSRPESGATVETKPPAIPGAPFNAFLLRYESHSDETTAENITTAVFTTTRQIGKSNLQTFYALFQTQEPRGNSENTGSFGLTWTHFAEKTLYGTATFNHPVKSKNSAARNTASLGLYKTMPLDADGNRLYRLSASYTTQTDFGNGDSYTLGAAYNAKQGRNRLALGYKYVYSLENNEHLYNRYSIDYSFLIWKAGKLTIGYEYIDKPYVSNPNTPDHDEVFRLSLFAPVD